MAKIARYLNGDCSRLIRFCCERYFSDSAAFQSRNRSMARYARETTSSMPEATGTDWNHRRCNSELALKALMSGIASSFCSIVNFGRPFVVTHKKLKRLAIVYDTRVLVGPEQFMRVKTKPSNQSGRYVILGLCKSTDGQNKRVPMFFQLLQLE